MLTALAWSPVLLLFILAVFLRRSALFLAVAGCLWTGVLAITVFRTPLSGVLTSALWGVQVTLPLLLVVYGGILLASVLIESGALTRLAAWFTGAARDEWEKVTLLSMGMGNALEGAGIIAEPVAAPMLRASGLSPLASASLAITGYSGLMTLGLGGVIITVLASVSGYPADILAGKVAILSVPASVLLAWSIPLFTGGPTRSARLYGYLTVAGLTAGAGCWLAVELVGYQVGELAGGVALTALIVGPRLGRLKVTRTLVRDSAPLLVMGAGMVAVNIIPGFREWARQKAVWGTLSPMTDAWLYLFVAFVAAHLLLAKGQSLVRALVRGTGQGWRPLAAMALFGSMGQVMAFTGWEGPLASTGDPAFNIPCLLAGTLDGLGGGFVILVPFLGWVGTFLTGYGVASIMLFTALLMEMAVRMGVSPEVMVCGLAVGASVGGVSSPFKVAFAASMCGAAGREGEILRKTIPLGIGVCLVLGVFLLFL
ncbi:MAG: L-lactate permease [bacterium]|nr:L-lactate permease [bacterium]